jgi:drug/metabolite transporter (DMT)-like permease
VGRESEEREVDPSLAQQLGHLAGATRFLVAGVALLASFVALQARVPHPLLPLRVLLDRNRGGALVAVLLLGVGTFGIFLFLTYYLQQNLALSPVMAGLAFMPMVVALTVKSNVATGALLPRFGPKPVVPVGMLIAATGLFLAQRPGSG